MTDKAKNLAGEFGSQGLSSTGQFLVLIHVGTHDLTMFCQAVWVWVVQVWVIPVG